MGPKSKGRYPYKDKEEGDLKLSYMGQKIMRTGVEVGGHSCELGGGRPGLLAAREAGEGQGRTRPQHLQEETTLPAPWCWASSL